MGWLSPSSPGTHCPRETGFQFLDANWRNLATSFSKKQKFQLATYLEKEKTSLRNDLLHCYQGVFAVPPKWPHSSSFLILGDSVFNVGVACCDLQAEARSPGLSGREQEGVRRCGRLSAEAQCTQASGCTPPKAQSTRERKHYHTGWQSCHSAGQGFSGPHTKHPPPSRKFTTKQNAPDQARLLGCLWKRPLRASYQPGVSLRPQDSAPDTRAAPPHEHRPTRLKPQPGVTFQKGVPTNGNGRNRNRW